MEGSPRSPGTPRFAEASPRFTEEFASPPYQQYHYNHAEQPPVPQYNAQGIETPLQPRLSNKDRPLSPELSSPFPESVLADEWAKEVAYPAPQPLPYQRPGELEGKEEHSRRVCGLPAKLFYGLLTALIALAIGLGVGLGVGLGIKHHSSTPASSASSTSATTNSTAPSATPTTGQEYLVGGALNSSYYSTLGAFNGSGIALASQSFTKDLQNGTQGSIVMYFQHHTGQIRYKQLSPDGDWLGGDASSIVAVDAKNSTPLSAVSYVLDGSSTWHIFYVDQNNTLKQRSNSNTSNVWVDGPLNQNNVKVNDADTVGMQACWYGNDYGDIDYNHTPVPGTGSSGASSEYGMHMWYASDDTTFQQLGWRTGDKDWAFQQSWPNLNGHAGVGCYSWGPGSATYVMFVDLNNTVNFYWKDTNTNVTANATHPINEWTNSSISIPNVDPATSLGYTNYFYAQMADGTVNGYNITWDAEKTSFVDDDMFTVGPDPALPGSHMSVTAIPNLGGGSDLLVFYQVKGDDVTEHVRDWLGGQWSDVFIPIPDS